MIALQWDSTGEVLAILQEGSGSVELWDLKSKQSSSVETNLKDLTFMSWSKSGPELAIGTAKGNLLVYNSRTRRKVLNPFLSTTM